MSEENKYTFENKEYRDTYRHTVSHILAQAVKRLYPEVKLAIGPSIDNGFYYDFDAPFSFTQEHLDALEAEMRKICKEKEKLERFELPRAEAIKFMEEREEPYKVELINDLPEDATISFYKQGEFTDLCAGPHLDSTGRVKGNGIKLMNVTGAYWRGDSSKKMLQRIYGTAFPKKDELDQYLNMLEEAKKRDHRKLGKELGLFMLTEEGPGFPFFLPKGMVLKNTLIDYWREVHKRYGYVEISTPMILNRRLWERSGHWDHYKQNMYTTVIDGEDYAIKPMNCPGGMMVYASEPHSYRDLPLRVGELGLVHRHELSGALHGLFRVRCFTQDDAHIFMTWDQMKDEIKNVVRLFDEVYSTFGLSYAIELSTMPDDHIGDEKDWRFAEDTLSAAITEMGKTFTVNAGDGAHSHPTQALLDIFTMREKKGALKDLKVTIVGDILHSRVARSNMWGLLKLGAKVTLAGPSTLVPREFEAAGVRVCHNLKDAVQDADVVNLLRIQHERQSAGFFPSTGEYAKFFGLNRQNLRWMKPDVLVMHPGPINRDVELTSEVADGPNSVILEQVTNGLAVRMAVLFLVAGCVKK